MKMQRVLFGLLGLLGITFAGCRYFTPPTPPRSIHDNQITLYSDGGGKCHLNSPVLNMSAHSDTVQWVPADNTQYSITFIKIDPPMGSTPLPAGYVKETPLVPPDEPVTIANGQPSRPYHVKSSTKYYYYAIFDQAYPTTPCKVSTDDHDPGLNVKQ